MRSVHPEVFLVAKPMIDYDGIMAYLEAVGGEGWWERSAGTLTSDAEMLVEFGGRMCYRSWEPGLNANVTKVRADSAEYLANIVASGHGSVLEHANYTFVFHNVSRVFTHELVRHRAGCAISQESMRFVRLTDDIPIVIPNWAQEDEELIEDLVAHVEDAEALQVRMAAHFRLDDEGVPFAEKKAKTSFMRRFAPDGVATGIVWTANLRTLRHVIEMRTAPGAEEEIREVFDAVAMSMCEEAPAVFADFTRTDDGVWTPTHRKV